MGTVLLIDPARGADPHDQSVIYAQYAQRAYPRAQELLDGTGGRKIRRPIQVGWHDVGLSDYTGAFAIVNEEVPDLVELIGAVVRVHVSGRSTLVLVLGSDSIDVDVTLARRAFLALAPLNLEPLSTLVEVVHEP